MGDVVAAVDRYTDMPEAVRAKLKSRMAARAYDEMVDIRRDSIVGQQRYRSEIRDMHFGRGQVCARVDRSRWSQRMLERGLVYCEDNHCILVPTVCRNVSRITREAGAVAGQRAGRPGGRLAPAEALTGPTWAAAAGGGVAAADGAGAVPISTPVFPAVAEPAVAIGGNGQGNGSGLLSASSGIAGTPVGAATDDSLGLSASVGGPGTGRPTWPEFAQAGSGPAFNIWPRTSTGPLPAVPEAPRTAMLLLGLAVLGWRAARRASGGQNG